MAQTHPVPNPARGGAFLQAARQLSYSQVLSVVEAHAVFDGWPHILADSFFDPIALGTPQLPPVEGERRGLAAPPPLEDEDACTYWGAWAAVGRGSVKADRVARGLVTEVSKGGTIPLRHLGFAETQLWGQWGPPEFEPGALPIASQVTKAQAEQIFPPRGSILDHLRGDDPRPFVAVAVAWKAALVRHDPDFADLAAIAYDPIEPLIPFGSLPAVGNLTNVRAEVNTEDLGSGAQTYVDVLWSHDDGVEGGGHTVTIYENNIAIVSGRDARWDHNWPIVGHVPTTGGWHTAKEIVTAETEGAVLRTFTYRVDLVSVGQVVASYQTQPLQVWMIGSVGEAPTTSPTALDIDLTTPHQASALWTNSDSESQVIIEWRQSLTQTGGYSALPTVLLDPETTSHVQGFGPDVWVKFRARYQNTYGLGPWSGLTVAYRIQGMSGGAPSWAHAYADQPAVGSSIMTLTLRATSAPEGYTGKMWARYDTGSGWSEWADITGSLSVSLATLPTVATEYTFSAVQPRASAGDAFINYQFRAEILDDESEVVSETGMGSGWFFAGEPE